MTRICAPRTLPWRAALCTVVLALSAASGAAAAGRDDGAYRQARDGAKAMYDAQRKQCRGMSGNAKDVCVAQAKANRVRAEAKADVTYRGGDRTRLVAARNVAEADYKLAKEKCDAQTGNARDVCVKEARAAMVADKADAKAARRIGQAQGSAEKEKREAVYKLALEKCNALSGDAKGACTVDAKANHDK